MSKKKTVKTEVANLGLGVMIRMLSGYEEAAAALKASIGKTITSIKLKDDEVIIGFKDAPSLILWDSGQSCCEHRYMTADGKPTFKSFKGATFDGIDIQAGEGKASESEYGEGADQQLLYILTSKGKVLFSAWNEHNGYYGGFSIDAKLEVVTTTNAQPSDEHYS